MPIIDPHHHLWDRGSRYLLDEVLKDIGSGHNVRATVYSQCDSMYRVNGETEFVNGVAAMSASDLHGPARVCAGIVGFADLNLGERIDPLLEAHLRASGRFRGVRHCSVWDADKTIKSTPIPLPRRRAPVPDHRRAAPTAGSGKARFSIASKAATPGRGEPDMRPRRSSQTSSSA